MKKENDRAIYEEIITKPERYTNIAEEVGIRKTMQFNYIEKYYPLIDFNKA